uniref:C2H2-type domain-containing protein n=1 Tax=Gopherus agassizii TaxID=38772 RepID=A0A452GXI6_9SAUR
FDDVSPRESFALKPGPSPHPGAQAGGKPYKCSECERSFCHRSSLRKHHLAHTGERAPTAGSHCSPPTSCLPPRGGVPCVSCPLASITPILCLYS